MFSVNTNLSAMAALQSLNTTATQLAQTQNAISTGKKISQASDNPAVYSISNSMNADLAGLSAVSDNLAFSQATLGVASSAASQISSQLATLKQTVTQSQQQGISPTVMQNQIDALLTNIDQFASSATFNGVNLLDGISSGLNIVQDVSGNTISVVNQNASVAGLGLTHLAANASAVNLAFSSSFGVANADVLTLSDGTNSYAFEFSDGSAQLTTTPSLTTKVFAVMVDPTTQSTLQMVGSLVSELRKQGFGATVKSDGSVDIAGNSITNAATSSSFASGGATQTAVTGSTAAIAVVDAAIQAMNGKAALLGQASQQVIGMQNFNSALKDSLASGLGALTDADMAAESARLQSLQTKQQLAVQSLSIANQQPQALLSLFKG